MKTNQELQNEINNLKEIIKQLVDCIALTNNEFYIYKGDKKLNYVDEKFKEFKNTLDENEIFTIDFN